MREDRCMFCAKERAIGYYGSARIGDLCRQDMAMKGFEAMISLDRPTNQKPNQALIGTTIESLERTLFGGIQIVALDKDGKEYIMVLEQDDRYPGWVGSEIRTERHV